MNIAVITGASSGMGKEFTTRLITENDARIGAPYDEIWIIARSEDKLISLQKALSPERIRVIPLDLTAPESLSSVSELLSKEKPDIRLLINCAGMGRNGAFSEQSVSDTHNAIALNCDALSSLTNICLPYMTGHKGPKGRSATIINIASSAADSIVDSWIEAGKAALDYADILDDVVFPRDRRRTEGQRDRRDLHLPRPRRYRLHQDKQERPERHIHRH